jgi:hypothetical protein
MANIKQIDPPVSPRGHYCASCVHLVRDTTPLSRAAKCCRFPPTVMAIGTMQGVQLVVASPGIDKPDEQWCGEWASARAPMLA